jgi:hypothetical protein
MEDVDDARECAPRCCNARALTPVTAAAQEMAAMELGSARATHKNGGGGRTRAPRPGALAGRLAGKARELPARCWPARRC